MRPVWMGGKDHGAQNPVAVLSDKYNAVHSIPIAPQGHKHLGTDSDACQAISCRVLKGAR